MIGVFSCREKRPSAMEVDDEIAWFKLMNSAAEYGMCCAILTPDAGAVGDFWMG